MVDEADDRPVLVGAIALVGVSLVIGLIVALVVMGGARVAGLTGGGGGGGGGEGAQPTLSLPAISETEFENQTITLTPEETEGAAEEEEAPAEEETTTEAAEPQITLQISATTASPMERIDVSGVYTGGDGAVLSIQRYTDGTWNDIASNAAVSGELFSTYIALGRPGENRVRAYDDAADLASNEVSITVE